MPIRILVNYFCHLNFMFILSIFFAENIFAQSGSAPRLYSPKEFLTRFVPVDLPFYEKSNEVYFVARKSTLEDRASSCFGIFKYFKRSSPIVQRVTPGDCLEHDDKWEPITIVKPTVISDRYLVFGGNNSESRPEDRTSLGIVDLKSPGTYLPGLRKLELIGIASDDSVIALFNDKYKSHPSIQRLKLNDASISKEIIVELKDSEAKAVGAFLDKSDQLTFPTRWLTNKVEQSFTRINVMSDPSQGEIRIPIVDHNIYSRMSLLSDKLFAEEYTWFRDANNNLHSHQRLLQLDPQTLRIRRIFYDYKNSDDDNQKPSSTGELSLDLVGGNIFLPIFFKNDYKTRGCLLVVPTSISDESLPLAVDSLQTCKSLNAATHVLPFYFSAWGVPNRSSDVHNNRVDIRPTSREGLWLVEKELLYFMDTGEGSGRQTRRTGYWIYDSKTISSCSPNNISCLVDTREFYRENIFVN